LNMSHFLDNRKEGRREKNEKRKNDE